MPVSPGQRKTPHLTVGLLPTELESEEVAVKTDMTPESSTSRSRLHNIGLLNLPNEILLYMFEDMEDQDLRSIARLSRRLHHLAFPAFLSRNGISSQPSSELVLFDDRSNDILKAVNAALFQPALNCLSCTITCHRSPDGEVRDELRSLRNFVGKLASTQEARFNLCRVSQPTAAGREIELSDDLVPTWTAILARECRSFTIRHSGTHTPASRDVNAVIVENFYGARGMKRKMARMLRPLAIIFSRFRTEPSMLETFNLHSSLAFHPTLCHWTVDTINHSHLRSLSISLNHSTDSSTWALILPCITIPTLTNLFIDHCSIETGDLFKFLRRHPLIEVFHLGRSTLSPNPHHVFPRKTMKGVTHLTAHPKWLVHLLTTRGSLPSLSCARILWRMQNGHRFSFHNLNLSLQTVAPRLRSLQELHLVLSFGSISSDWMTPTAITDSEDVSKTASLACVTHLELHVGAYRLPLSMVARLPKWLAAFPLLRRLKVLTLSRSGPFCCSESNLFIRSVLEACPKLEDIEFGVEPDFISY
ncbi:hypothetical protein B0H34DRAFT_692899 [Crassisporium funariophilum]|nr:hypothetical protein B0H34DRAFT_692899 [Crassisporium funariophilum]